jgi:flagellar biosynthesis component FlhA
LKTLTIQYKILLVLTVTVMALMAFIPSVPIAMALCVTIIALQAESYLDSVRYKKTEEIRQDIETLAKAIDDLAGRTAKMELRNAFNPEQA